VGELNFNFNDIFVSLTDKKGVIRYGNDTFATLSGYELEEMIGAPHNIVRHPEMPRAVFKVFWNFLTQDKPVFAFVNNKTKTGENYWVFACVVPGQDKNFISIRLKPTSALFSVAKELYAKVLKYEKTHGMDKAHDYMHAELLKLGFDSYDSFMSQALIEELNADRYEEILKMVMPKHTGSITKSEYKNLIAIQSNSRIIMNELKVNFSRLNAFREQMAVIKKAGDEIKKSTRGLDYLSCNMSITAHKLGKDGQGLSVVAQTFQRKLSELGDKKKAVTEDIDQFAEMARSCLVASGISLIEVMMLKAFSLELVRKFLNQNLAEETKQAELRLLAELLKTTETYFEETSKKLEQMALAARGLRKDVFTAKTSFVAINIVGQGGRLEGAKSVQLEKAFSHFLGEINRYLTDGERPFNEINSQLLDMVETMKLTEKILKQNTVTLQQLNYDITRIARKELVA
jgi:aerotaxis receptor